MLNIQQQNMVQENHHLIYSVLHATIFKSEALDDYYGDAAFGLCKAAESYDESKGAFSTYAYHLIQNEIRREVRRERRRTNDYMLRSLDYLDNNDPPDEHDYCLEIEESCDFWWLSEQDEKKQKKLMLEYIIEKTEGIISQREREMLKMLIDRKTQTEIGEALQITQSQVSRNVKKLKTKVINALREE